MTVTEPEVGDVLPKSASPEQSPEAKPPIARDEVKAEKARDAAQPQAQEKQVIGDKSDAQPKASTGGKEEAPSSAQELKHEKEAPAPLEHKVPPEVHEHAQSQAQIQPQQPSAPNPGRDVRPSVESEEFRMPGSFSSKTNHSSESGSTHHLHSWADFFKKMHIK